MDVFYSFLNDFVDAVCVFGNDGSFLFRNSAFIRVFQNVASFSKLKKRFNFDLCLLSSENISDKTPLDIMISSREKFHTVASYRNDNGEYLYFYIYTLRLNEKNVAVFKNISTESELDSLKTGYNSLLKKYDSIKVKNDKYYKLSENAGAQVLKMGIINKIALVIRETDDLSVVLDKALYEIHELCGSYKTYFSIKHKDKFKIVYSLSEKDNVKQVITEYEPEIINSIKNKNITVTSCLKEYLNSDEIIKRTAKRIIIPLYNKNKLLGIIVTFTVQKFNVEENTEVLQSAAVQLSTTMLRSALIKQLDKKNKKLVKTLKNLKETQIQLINTEKLASLGRLVSGVAHEINTPLGSINSNTDLISKVISGDTLSCDKKLQLISDLNSVDKEAVKRISSIVKSLKKFVRLDEAEFQPANINDELDLTLKLTEHETKNNIEIIRKYSDIPPVMCSVNMLNQVFMNLIINACASINNSGRKGQITITTKCRDNKLYVKIKDTGTGIPDNIKNKIFNAGFTTKEKGIGTGLGLAVSKKIIELHKGSITFKSALGKGTEFTVSIPLNLN